MSSAISTEAIAAVLADRYGLIATDMAQLPIGQGTINFRVTCADRDSLEVFVKAYPAEADLAVERRAITLSELARHHGVPAARILPSDSGEFIEASTAVRIAVWQWIPGQVVTTLNRRQLERAGRILGRLHALFAAQPESAMPSSEADAWRNINSGGLRKTIDYLLELIAQREADKVADSFDQLAEATLRERRVMLGRIPGLLAELPADLSTQVIHGDYSPVNLLFAGDELAAVIDFRPPHPFLLAYELGRMAFYPTTVANDPDWPDAARAFITAYLHANPTVTAADVLACGRAGLLQLLRSLYGVKQHYLKPGLFQTDLDQFWRLRHTTAQILLDHLEQIDQLLAELAHPRGYPSRQKKTAPSPA